MLVEASPAGAAVVDVVVLVVGVVAAGVVLVAVGVCAGDSGVVLVGVVVVVPAGGEALGVVAPELEEDEPEGEEDELVVVPPDVDEELVDELFEDGGFANRPLLLSSVWICCWTVPTAAVIAAGVPPAPSDGRPLSCLRSAASFVSNACDGCEVSVTTIWSASAVVMQAGQL